MIFRKIFLSIFLCFGVITLIYAAKFRVLYKAGQQRMRARDYKAALSKFQAAFDCAELSHEEVTILFAIAELLAKQKKYKDARNWIKRVLDIPDLKHKNKIKAYLCLINYSISLKRYDDALNEVNTALSNLDNDKDKAAFFSIHVKIFEVQKKYPEALEAVQDYIVICKAGSPQWQNAQRRLVAILFKQKKYKQLLELIAEFKVDEWEASSRRFVCYYAGLCAFRLRRYKLAASWFARMPDKGPAWLVYSKNSQLGTCWKKLNEYEKAYRCFELIYTNSKLQNYYRADSLWIMADLRYLQKKYRESRVLCEKLKKFPKVSKSQIERADRLIASIKKTNY